MKRLKWYTWNKRWTIKNNIHSAFTMNNALKNKQSNSWGGVSDERNDAIFVLKLKELRCLTQKKKNRETNKI